MGKYRKYNVATSKLTPEQVYRIRQLYHEEGWSQGRLAREFQMSTNQIGKIVRGESWQAVGMVENMESEMMHNRGLLAGRDLEAEAEESAKRLMALMAQEPQVVPRAPAMPLSEEVKARLRGYGAQGLGDEPQGTGLAKLESELKGFTEEQAQQAERELEDFINMGDTK